MKNYRVKFDYIDSRGWKHSQSYTGVFEDFDTAYKRGKSLYESIKKLTSAGIRRIELSEITPSKEKKHIEKFDISVNDLNGSSIYERLTVRAYTFNPNKLNSRSKALLYIPAPIPSSPETISYNLYHFNTSSPLWEDFEKHFYINNWHVKSERYLERIGNGFIRHVKFR